MTQETKGANSTPVSLEPIIKDTNYSANIQFTFDKPLKFKP